MFKLVHSLALLAVLYHTMVGCCGHHAHAAQASRDAADAIPVSCCAEHDHQHGDEHDHGCPPDQPCRESNHCCCGNGVFVVPQSGSPARPAHDLTWFAETALQTMTAAGSPGTRTSCEFVCADIAPPVRIHLWHQIILI
jgi:hypothetical protein